MLDHFETLNTTRKNFLYLTRDYSEQQLNHIPPKFSNNLIWQLGHVLVTQQLLTYGLSKLPPRIDPALITKYRSGTVPDQYVRQEEIDQIKGLLLSTVDQTKHDFEQGIFQDFKPYHTQYNLSLKSLEDAIFFNHMHEAMHLGYVFSIRKFVHGL